MINTDRSNKLVTVLFGLSGSQLVCHGPFLSISVVSQGPLWTISQSRSVRILLGSNRSSRSVMARSNSGNFGIFYSDRFYLNLISSLESALKILKNDTDIAYEL